MFRRAISRAVLATVLGLGNSPLLAAPNCPTPAYKARTTDQITSWFEIYLRPFRELAGIPDGPSMTMNQIEPLLEKMEIYHRNGTRDSTFFEALVQQISADYARSPGFKGFDTLAAKKMHKTGSGPDIDYSLMCIDARTTRFPDDTFAITLFGVSMDNCQHVGLRGLVFTDILVNGSMNGECHPDHVYYKQLIFSVNAGTNTVTFLCRKDKYGCIRQ